MGLRSYIETGIALDAVVTYDLLVSIFHPATPLHDGAVVIQGNRVAAAACFLPLTVNPELSRTLGSRHRAAIGAQRGHGRRGGGGVRGDAARSRWSQGGRIRRGLDGPALKQDLLGSLGLGEKPASAAPQPAEVGRGERLVRLRALRGDVPLRLASLALAAGLWFVIAGRQTAERGLSVPVELRNVPRELELTGDAVNTVDVRVRASPGLIDSLDPRKVLGDDRPGRGAGGREDRPADARPHPGAVRLPGGEDHALAAHAQPREHAAQGRAGAAARDRPAGRRASRCPR